MLKKRIIFTLLYDNGYFMLSRNFRLQKVGDLQWLRMNYNFSHISFFIDELIVLDVTRGARNEDAFCAALESLTEGCFVPIAAGGGIRTVEYARRLLRSGADKVVVNSALFTQPALSGALVENFGQQCVIGSLDFKRNLDGEYDIWIESGSKILNDMTPSNLNLLPENVVGEWYINSIDRDGTGQGFDLNILNHLPIQWDVPIIIAGGAGNASHLAAGLFDARVDAVATANLFNFVGDGLKQARKKLLSSGIELATWPAVDAMFDGEVCSRQVIR